MTRSRSLFIFVFAVISACSPSPKTQTDSEAFNRAYNDSANSADEWRSYLSNAEHTHYSALSQINRSNVAKLSLAWEFNTGDAADDGSSQIQCNPLVVKGLLYCTTATLKVFALNAATGEQVWTFDPHFSQSLLAPNSNRGVTYWEAAGNDVPPRILYTAGSKLFALNAHSGEVIRDFGEQGASSLHLGLPDWAQDLDVVSTTPGTVFKDLLIIGTRVSEGRGAAPGHVRAFNVRSGELAWIFHTIPQAGEPGSETWPSDTRDAAGGANSWAGIAVDHERGLAFVPTGSPTFDFYGADRLGDNLYANSLVALDASTGERQWHYQFVRHDLWDRDLPAPPNLIDWPSQDGPVAAVAQATKTGHVFVFERETGTLLTPVSEVAVQGEAVGDDEAAKTQPISHFPPFTEQVFRPSTRTESIAAATKLRVAQLDPHAQYRPPSMRGTILYPGIDGGAEWGGMAYDPLLNYLYINANEVPHLLQMVQLEGDLISPEFAYMMLCAACHGVNRMGDGISVPGLLNISDRMGVFDLWAVVRDGRGRMPSLEQMPAAARAAALYWVWANQESSEDPAAQAGVNASPGGVDSNEGSSTADTSAGGDIVNAGYQRLLDIEGMPASEPPWGTLTALDLKRGRTAWRIPFGNYPKMLEQGQEGLGSENYGGPITTAGGVLFIAATPDRRFKAYDSRSGELLWSVDLPYAGFATPSTYSVDGRQYVVVAAGGGKLGQPSGGRYMAYALPLESTTQTQSKTHSE